MAWTNQEPTAPGFYWRRWISVASGVWDGKPGEVCSVIESDFGRGLRLYGPFEECSSSTGGESENYEYWDVKIPEPEEEQ